jgi:hypothetical protein
MSSINMNEVKAFLNKISTLAGGFEVTKEMIEETKSLLGKKDDDKKEKVKKVKKAKDMNAPKKPTNAYMIYAKEMRSEIAKEDSKDIIREIARRWNEEKSNNSDVYKEYNQKLLDAKEKYTSDMEDYVSSSDEEEKDEKTPKKKKEKKDPNAPKKPTNAYMIYAKDMRSKISGISNAKDLVKEIARRWNKEKANDSDVYKEYTQKLHDAKNKYTSDMEDYASSDEEKIEKKIDFESPKKNDKESEEVRAMMRVPEPPKKKIVKKNK